MRLWVTLGKMKKKNLPYQSKTNDKSGNYQAENKNKGINEEKIKTLFKSFPKRLGLNTLRISRLLSRLGNPQNRMPPVIHVAGTNGKGSTIAFIRAGLEASGYRVHVFSSPHLTSIRERIRISGEQIEPEYFDSLLSEVIESNKKEKLSFFELLTAVAFMAFSQNKADWTILEVGLGGRLDSTNVITPPRLSVITPISMDHEEFLGNTLREIATEKAGILKPKTKAIFAKQNGIVLDVLRERAKILNCLTRIQNEDFYVRVKNSSLLFSDSFGEISIPRPKLEGSHQVDNAGVAIAALRELGCMKEYLSNAMERVYWPGRLQRISQGILSPDNLGFDAELFLDGGHNPSAGIAIANWVKELTPGTFYLILGMMKNKDLEGFLKPLRSKVDKLLAVRIPEEINAQDPQTIAITSAKLKIPSLVSNSIGHALYDIKKEKSTLPKRILITGSLYLVGNFLKANSSRLS